MSNIPKRNLASGCHLLKKLIKLLGGLLDITTNIYLKSCAYHPDSECCTFFHGNLSDPKSSEDTLLYLYVIWNMLKSADLHETILTPVICHKHVRYHDGVTLYFSVKFPSVAPKKTRNGYFQPPRSVCHSSIHIPSPMARLESVKELKVSRCFELSIHRHHGKQWNLWFD